MNNFPAQNNLNKESKNIFCSNNNATPTTNEVQIKVIEDIEFLRDRITRLKSLRTPNSNVLRTYEDMLKSREAVLKWLQEDTNNSQSTLKKHVNG